MAHLPVSQYRRLNRASVVLAGYEPVQLSLMIVGRVEIRLLPVDALTA
jgi:hypothetical protein